MKFTLGVKLLGLPLLALAVSGCNKDDTKHVSTGQASGAASVAALSASLTAAGVSSVSQPLTESAAMVDLGKSLFYDKEISGNRNISCATCHHPTAWTGDNLPLSIGEGGQGLAQVRVTTGANQIIPRNAPNVFNGGVPEMVSMFWDSRIVRDPLTGVLTTPEPALNGASPPRPDMTAQLTSALAAQALFPPTSHDEMRGSPGDNEIADATNNLEVWSRLMVRLVGTANGTIGGIAEYRTKFALAFPAVQNVDDLTFAHAARAMAAFEREAWTAIGTPFDRYLTGDHGALSKRQREGAELFYGAANCSSCHSGPLLTDFGHHSLAVPQLGPGKAGGDDLGLSLETGLALDDYKFRTPPLRNVALTGPWMHDGAFLSLEAAVKHHLDPVNGILNYDVSQLPPYFQPLVDLDAGRIQARIATIDPLLNSIAPLTQDQIDLLLEFLNSLTDPDSLNLIRDVPATVPSGLPVFD